MAKLTKNGLITRRSYTGQNSLGLWCNTLGFDSEVKCIYICVIRRCKAEDTETSHKSRSLLALGHLTLFTHVPGAKCTRQSIAGPSLLTKQLYAYFRHILRRPWGLGSPLTRSGKGSYLWGAELTVFVDVSRRSVLMPISPVFALLQMELGAFNSKAKNILIKINLAPVWHSKSVSFNRTGPGASESNI